MSKGLCLVTGASTGIGFELAHIAAAEGYDLIVVANEPLILASADDFREHGGQVEAVEADLASFHGVEKVLAAAQGRPFEIVCANAGAGIGGAFLDQAPADWRRSIDTNVTGTVYLIQKVLGEMTARNNGKLLVTGSIAGYVPGAFMAVYNATKAFIDNFTDAIRNEIKDFDGVTLTTLMPGATETEFFARADMLDTKVGASAKADPGKVARDGWDALMGGKAHIISGLMNKLTVAAASVTPAAILAEQNRKMAEPGSAED